jgi:hypothetical protein
MLRILLAFLLLAVPASAEQWAVFLGDRQIGTVTLTTGPTDRMTLTSVLDSTPLGLADGTFTASSFPAVTPEGRRVTQYLSEAKSSRKARNISVLTDAGLAVETRVEPAVEATSLSDAARVSAPVLNPVEAFARIARSTDCPEELRYYDGRRVIEISLNSKKMEGLARTCEFDYLVVAGPGHLSPFRFRSVALGLDYEGSGPAALQQITLSAGGFTASLRR